MTVTIRLLCAITNPKQPGLLVNLAVTGDGEARHWNAAHEVARGLADKRLIDLRKAGRRFKDGDLRLQWVVDIDTEEFRGMLCSLEISGDGSVEHWRDAFNNARHTCGQRMPDAWVCADNQALRWHGFRGMALAGHITREFAKTYRRGHDSMEAQPLHVPASGPISAPQVVRPPR